MWYNLNEDHSFTKVDSLMGSEQTFGDKRWQVGKDELEDGTLVSTVFLGLDHNLFSEGDPILFETMIFNNPDLEGYQERYKTWDAAKKAHDKIVNHLKEKLCEDL